MAPGGKELNTWAEIAFHLGVSVRTAQNWEKEFGLPVKRITEGSKARVLASVQDLDDWKLRRIEQFSAANPLSEIEDPGPAPAMTIAVSEDARQPLEEAPRPQRRHRLRMAAYVAVFIALAGVAVLVRIAGKRLAHEEPVARVTVAGRSVRGLDANGNELWTYSFTQPFAPEAISYTKRSLSEFVRVSDLRGRGERETLIVAPFRFGPNPSDPATIELVCFSARGELLWSFEPTATLQFGEQVLDGPWNILDVIVSKERPHPAIWAAFGHGVWGNSIVFQIDPVDGHATARFVNSGQLFALNEVKSGGGKTFLLAGGFNNEYEMGVLAVVDESKPFAASPQTPRTRHACTSCSAGSPDYYFVFPHSELNALAHDWLDGVRNVNVLGADIDLVKHEVDRNFSASARYLLQLEPNVHFVSVLYGTDYDLEHRKLERTGAIQHAVANCPERIHPRPIRVWNEASGWNELTVKSTTGE